MQLVASIDCLAKNKSADYLFVCLTLKETQLFSYHGGKNGYEGKYVCQLDTERRSSTLQAVLPKLQPQLVKLPLNFGAST